MVRAAALLVAAALTVASFRIATAAGLVTACCEGEAYCRALGTGRIAVGGVYYCCPNNGGKTLSAGRCECGIPHNGCPVFGAPSASVAVSPPTPPTPPTARPAPPTPPPPTECNGNTEAQLCVGTETGGLPLVGRSAEGLPFGTCDVGTGCTAADCCTTTRAGVNNPAPPTPVAPNPDPVADGGWGEWSDCTFSCVRTRTCVDTAGVGACQGAASEVCFEAPCTRDAPPAEALGGATSASSSSPFSTTAVLAVAGGAVITGLLCGALYSMRKTLCVGSGPARNERAMRESFKHESELRASFADAAVADEKARRLSGMTSMQPLGHKKQTASHSVSHAYM